MGFILLGLYKDTLQHNVALILPYDERLHFTTNKNCFLIHFFIIMSVLFDVVGSPIAMALS